MAWRVRARRPRLEPTPSRLPRLAPVRHHQRHHTGAARHFAHGDAQVDLDQLVHRTAGFSPADIEYAARKGSQRALEAAVYQENQQAAPSTDDYDWAIGETRMTVSKEVAEEFLVDIDQVARL